MTTKIILSLLIAAGVAVIALAFATMGAVIACAQLGECVLPYI